RPRPRPGGRGVQRARPRHARLRHQEWLPRGSGRAVRGDRLLAGRLHRRRRAGRRSRARRVHAIAVLGRPLEGRRRQPRRGPRRRRTARAGQERIPEAVLTKPPSAGLRPGQRDDESLPPYEVLDPVLEAYVEADLTAGELVEAGFDPEVVRRVVRLVDLAEYKRRQNPPGVRVTPKAFGKDRRVPITNAYRG